VASPFVRPYAPPRSPDDYPIGPCFTAGHLVETNASWRSERPVLSVERCTGCLRCYLACPDGAVLRAGAVVRLDTTSAKAVESARASARRRPF